MITEDYTSFKTAKILKEKGFNETCRAFWKDWNGELHLCNCCRSHVFDFCNNSMLEEYYNDDEEINIAAPTLQMVMKWLREARNRYVEICMDKAHNFKDIVFRPAIYDKRLDCLWESDNFPTYEEACEAAIKYCLENLI